MMRGTFANIRIRNELMDGAKGGNTKHFPSGDVMPIYDAAMRYQKEAAPLIIIAGKEYGTGSSRDWAAKGTRLLGVRAVVAESFERIHRSNLVGMGVLPLEFKGGMTRADLKLTGEETFGIAGITDDLRPHMDAMLTINRKEGVDRYMLLCRLDTLDEVEYFRHGGILPFVLRSLLQTGTA
jgi:aconitate hydratase